MNARTRALLPAAVIVVVTTIAYWFTLSSLADFLRLDTPLAYLLLLPAFSLLLAVVTVVRYEGRPLPPRILLLDVFIGGALIIVALMAVTVLPASWSTYYWADRPDVISLVLFVSGAIILCYGTGWFWRLRASIAFLVLMWPALYLNLLAGPMQNLSDATNATLAFAANHLPLGVISGAGNTLIVETPSKQLIWVVVSTACAGANGVVGVLLMGSALALMFTGSRVRKLVWLACGMVLVFALNIVRLISILELANLGHPGFALGGYHAVIGLVLFALTLGVMLFATRWFGLQWTLSMPAVPRPVVAAVRSRRRRVVSAAQRARWVAIGVVLALASGLAYVAESSLGDYASFIDGTGSPTVAALDVKTSMPAGWTASFLATYPWATQYFGTNSEFDRYVVTHGDGSLAWMDIIRTDDQGSLDAYNLQACFLFHNDTLNAVQRVDLGNGVTGLVIDYTEPTTQDRWAAVSWALPVAYDGGISYERITLTTSVNYDGGAQAPDPQPDNGFRDLVLSLLNGAGGDGNQLARYAAADHAMQGVAQSIAGAMVSRRAG